MESLTIQALFDAENKKFRIPSYQRAYSWDEKQINQFIDDLKSASGQYYLGHFLFEEAEDKNTLFVVDGQQRLTTCVIFFSTLIEELKKRSVNLIDIEHRYIQDVDKRIQKFETVAYDNNFFWEEIIERKKCNRKLNTKSQQKIHQAKEIFEKEFAETATEELERWCDLVQNATITSYIISDKVQAAQIFGFQNDRGKALTKLELIKSYFMLQNYLFSGTQELTEQNIQFLEREFSNIYQKIVLVDTKEDDVLTYFWRSYSGDGLLSEEVVKDTKTVLNEVENDKKVEWIKNYISGLSAAFDSVKKVEESNEFNIQNLRYLNNMALSYPFLIKADRIGVSDKTYSRLSALLENITFRSLLRGGRAGIESRINWILTDMHSDDEINQSIDELIKLMKSAGGWWSYWNDGEMWEWLNSGWFYGNRVDNYVLWRYELSLASVNYPNPQITFDKLISNESIEHIAPKTPTNGDPVANGYGVYEDEENKDNGIVSGRWLNCVGNLMLISQSHNSSIGNKPFADKLASYGRDNLLNQQREIETFVTDKNNPVWDKNAIEQRHNKILDAAMKIWDLDKI